MDWDETENLPITLGEEKLKKVTLPPNYFEKFMQDRDIAEDICCGQKIYLQLEPASQSWDSCKCKHCLQPGRIVKHNFIGSVIEVTISCENQYEWKWASSAVVNHVYAVNIQLLAAVILSGNLFLKFSLLAKFLSMSIPAESTLYTVARLFVYQQVYSWWEEMQKLCCRW